MPDPTTDLTSAAAARMRVTLFGPSKTTHARSDQPALQILLQLRDLYEKALERAQSPTANGHDIDRAERIAVKMWDIIHACMAEYNRSVVEHTRLQQAERAIAARTDWMGAQVERTKQATQTLPPPTARKLPGVVVVQNPAMHDLSDENDTSEAG